MELPVSGIGSQQAGDRSIEHSGPAGRGCRLSVASLCPPGTIVAH